MKKVRTCRPLKHEVQLGEVAELEESTRLSSLWNHISKPGHDASLLEDQVSSLNALQASTKAMTVCERSQSLHQHNAVCYCAPYVL